MTVPPPTDPLISVIIPHLDQLVALEACLSLEVQTLPRSLFEIVVVDNGSTSRPENLIAQFPGVRLLQESTPGPGPARNKGAQNARGGILCFIDADCRAHADWLAVAFAALRSALPGTILGGQVLIWREDQTRYNAIEAYETLFSYQQHSHIARHGYSGTGNLVVYSNDFARVGPFADIFVAEDMDWGVRARDAGFTFKYVPDLIVYHPARVSLKALCIQWNRQIQHALSEARQRPYWRIYWAVRACAVLCSPWVHGIRVMTTERMSWSARFKASTVLFAIRAYRAWRMMLLLWSSGELVVWNRDVAISRGELR